MTTPNLMLPEVPKAIRNASTAINAGFLTVDAVLQLAVISRTVTAPPWDAVQGDRYIIPAGATGEWQNRANQIAFRGPKGWSFHVPRPGWLAWSQADRRLFVYLNSTWQPWPAATALRATWVRGSGALETPTTDVAIYIPTSMRITGVSVIGNGGPGSCQIDIRKVPVADFPPDSSDTICGGSKPAIAGAHTYIDTTLSGWTTDLDAGDTLVFHLESSVNFTALFVALHV